MPNYSWFVDRFVAVSTGMCSFMGYWLTPDEYCIPPKKTSIVLNNEVTAFTPQKSYFGLCAYYFFMVPIFFYD
jgi:hypothetical protein